MHGQRLSALWNGLIRVVAEVACPHCSAARSTFIAEPERQTGMLSVCLSGKITCQCRRAVSGASRKAEERSKAHVRERSKKVEAADGRLELEIEVRSVLG